MHPDPPPNTWEPDEPTELRFRGGMAGWENLRESESENEDRDSPFRWVKGEDSEGLAPLGGKGRASGRDQTWDADPMEWFTRLSDRLLLWSTRIGAVLCLLFFVLFCWGVWKVVEWIVESLPK
jgi:predicted secreted protein